MQLSDNTSHTTASVVQSCLLIRSRAAVGMSRQGKTGIISTKEKISNVGPNKSQAAYTIHPMDKTMIVHSISLL